MVRPGIQMFASRAVKAKFRCRIASKVEMSHPGRREHSVQAYPRRRGERHADADGG